MNRSYNEVRPHASLGYKPPVSEVFVAGFATWIGFAGHAGATASTKLTFNLDHSMWAAQGRDCQSGRGCPFEDSEHQQGNLRQYWVYESVLGPLVDRGKKYLNSFRDGRKAIAPDWLSFWDKPHRIYANARHRDVHYALIAREIAEHALALAPSRDARVLDYGCGEALHADVIAAACGQVLLCDGAPSVRARLASRFAGDANIRVLTPEEVARLAEHRLDLIVFHSVVQYLKPEEARALFLLFHRLLKSSGALLVSDVIPPQVSYDTSAAALLRFGASEGFLFAALASLMRTVFSDYRQSRRRFGFTRFSEAAMLENLAAADFAAAREPKNMGHDQTRMAFIARKIV